MIPCAANERLPHVLLFPRLGAFALLAIVVTVVVSSLITYRFAKASLEQVLSSELFAIVNSKAPQIDGVLLDLIRSDSQGGFSGQDEFEEIRRTLVNLRLANALDPGQGSPLYIVRRADGATNELELEFVVMTDKDASGRFFVGNHYSGFPYLLPGLRGTPATSGIYEDSEGIWISAAAPIRTRDGTDTAVLQADRPVNFFYAEARLAATRVLIGAGISVVVAAGIAPPRCPEPGPAHPTTGPRCGTARRRSARPPRRDHPQ